MAGPPSPERPGYGGDGGPATSARLRLGFLGGLAVDGSGNLFIADTGNHAVRRVSPNGTITTVAGTGLGGFSGDGGPAATAQLANPTGVAVDRAGNLFVSDYGNFRIRKVSRNGIISTVAGNGAPGLSGDGGPATSAQLYGTGNDPPPAYVEITYCWAATVALQSRKPKATRVDLIMHLNSLPHGNRYLI